MFTKADLRQKYVDEAVDFLITHVYKGDEEAIEILKAFKSDDIHWSTTCRFSKMRYSGSNYLLDTLHESEPRHYESNRKKPIRINCKSSSWHTYKKKTVGKYADHIRCSESKLMVIHLIHELTHVIQYSKSLPMSEVETTRNEIEWVRLNHSHMYEKLSTFED